MSLSRTRFEPVRRERDLLVRSDSAKWHLKHGWIWNVREQKPGEARPGRALGVCYATLLGCEGAFLHFETLPGEPGEDWALFFSAARKALRILAKEELATYLSIPAANVKLIRAMESLGFRRLLGGGYLHDGIEKAVLKLPDWKREHINETQKRKERNER